MCRLAAWVVGLVLFSLARLAIAAPPESPPPAPPIPAIAPAEQDAAIEARLEAIYAELDTLAEVEVEVASGVVHLSGSALAIDAAAEAESIARRIEGVVAVNNDIEQISAVNRRLQPLLDTLEKRALELWRYVPLVVVGLVIVLLAWGLGRLIGRVWEKFHREQSNAFVRELGIRGLRAVVVIIGVVLALELVGAATALGTLLGTAGVLGIVVGLAFKNTGENYLTSVLLSLRKPFEPNDLVEIEGQTGRVVRLTSRATILLTLDGNHVRMPNALVFRSTIINYTRNPQRRFSFKVGVSVDADLTRVQALACETLAATPGVLAEPCPTCLVNDFGDSAMIVSIGGWIDQREADWLKVGSEARRRIKVAFDQAGIEVPEPIVRVRTRAMAPELPVGEVSEEAVAVAADVEPDRHLIEQVASERAEAGDLLDGDAPIE